MIIIPRRRRASPRRLTITRCRRSGAPRQTGIYDIRGGGAKRRVPHFDDLLFLGASISRYPLEGYREKCDDQCRLGTRHAKKPIELKIPITIAGMSFGALSAHAKEALGRGASIAGTSTTTGDGGMTPEERGQSKTLVYQYLPSRYGMNPDDLRKADAIEVVVGSRRQARRRRHAARTEDFRPRRRHAQSCRRVSISGPLAGIPIGRGQTISKSRSLNCARSPAGKSRSM